MRKYLLKSIVYIFTILASFAITTPSIYALDANSNYQVNNCTCAHSGQIGSNVNPINCPAPAGWNQRYNAGNPNYPEPWSNYTFFCGNYWPCTPGGKATGGDFQAFHSGRKGNDDHVGAGTFELQGVTCQQPIADCTCNNPGSGSSINGGDDSFTCTLRGSKSETGTAICSHTGVGVGSDTNTSCLPNPRQLVTGQLYNLTGIASAPTKLYGVKCGITTPLPPPSPPCVTWSKGNCTTFGSAMGKLATSPSGFIQTIFAILLSISGGIALLLIIKAGYQLMTSQGKPEQLQNGRDQLIAAIVGLVFLIFSFVFLQLIGFDILHIPGFGP